MTETQTLSFSGTSGLAFSFAVLLVLTGVVLAVIAIRRSGYKRMIGGLELLRIALLILVALMICQPEWVQSFLPETEPVLVVLWDESDSMNTQDVPSPGGAEKDEVVSRKESIERFLNPDFWSPAVGERNREIKIVIEPFSSELNPPTSATDIDIALQRTVEKHSNLRGIVMLTDGSWNHGNSPSVTATLLRTNDVPVWAVAVGSETPLPDLELVSLEAPTFGVVNKPTRIPFTISSTLPRDVDVDVTFSSNDGERMVNRLTMPANGTLQQAFLWNPQKIGDYELNVEVEVVDGERIVENNRLTVPIEIRRESLKVLIVESYSRWEYRFLRNALSRDPGVEVRCVLYQPDVEAMGGGKEYLPQFPDSVDALSTYDVIFLGDVGIGDGQLTVEDCRRIKGLVQNQATGLILMPGMRGRQFSLIDTELSDLFPVVFDFAQPRGWGNRVPAQLQLTEVGSQSLLTKLADSAENNMALWNRLPGFQWYAPVLRAKIGSQVLAVHSSESNAEGRIPLLVTKTFGAGKILFMGTDGAWRWREGVEDKYHYRFWGQVARWMAYQRNMAGGDSMRLFYSPDRPRTGQTLSLNANVMAADGEPLQTGQVAVQLVAPSGNVQNVQLSSQAETGQWGLFTGSFVPQEIGEHRATLTCRETGGTLQTTISVQGMVRERLGQPVNFASLQEVAAITRGQVVKPEDIEQVLTAIRKIPEPEPETRRIRLWGHPLWVGLLIGLMSLLWIGRKLAGLV
ncbi:hypothetical protein SH449x_000236 [Pirellulaceae bacterium SH449]